MLKAKNGGVAVSLVKKPHTSNGTKKQGVRTLAIDVGGTGLKALVLDDRGEPITERQRVETPRPATPESVVDALVKHVKEILEQIEPIWNPRRIYIGGGNAKHVRLDLRSNVRITDNVAGLLGGIALWEKP